MEIILSILGTPQPTDPGNLLKKNLKRKVDVRMDKKLDEIPKTLSPYTLIVGETENGSPVEQFIKTKPSKENITGKWVRNGILFRFLTACLLSRFWSLIFQVLSFGIFVSWY